MVGGYQASITLPDTSDTFSFFARLERSTGNRLLVGDVAQQVVNVRVDRIADQLHRAIAEQHIETVRMAVPKTEPVRNGIPGVSGCGAAGHIVLSWAL